MKDKRLKKKDFNYILLALTLLALCAFTASQSKYFLKVNNLLSVMSQMSEIGIMAIGLNFIIISGGLDLSAGYICALSTIIAAILMVNGVPVFFTIIITLICSILMGAFNGFMISKFKLPPMLLTLGTSYLFQGIAMVPSKGSSISGLNPDYFFFGQGKVFGVIPFQIVLYAVLLVCAYLLLNKTSWGLRVVAMGNNTTACRFSGIGIIPMSISVYALGGLMSGISGIVISSRVATARPDLGNSYLMQCVSAVVLGGTSIAGGEGNIPGTILSVAIFATISNGFSLMGISAFIQQIVLGLLLITIMSISGIKTMLNERTRRLAIIKGGTKQ